METPTLNKLTELRRACSLLAGVLMMIALAFPMWKIVLTAPQYPGRALPVTMYAYPRIGGEYKEVHMLNKYVGFHYPDPVLLEPNYTVSEAALNVPEWSLAPLLFIALGLGAIIVALSSESTIERRLKRYFVGTIAIMVAVLAWTQFRLYQAGHHLDPSAPIAGVEGFTPPVLGPYSVANITGYSWFGPGGYIVIAALLLLGVAFLARDTDAPIVEFPDLVSTKVEYARGRITDLSE